MSITAFGDRIPVFGHDAFVHPDASVIGDVVLGDRTSVWPGSVLRGDLEGIVIGACTSLQDNCVGHTDHGHPLIVGADSVVGHGVILHGASVGARCLIGMGSILLNGCEIGDESIVGAGALVTQDKRFPARTLIVGSPAKAVREVTDEDLSVRASLHEMYLDLSRRYAALGLGADLAAFRR
jgi:carbonic anhydrase/acetyltransferase-like protein (isoleucine patch superfamily)